MNKILIILFVLISNFAYSQSNPSGNPSQNIAGWITNDYTVPRLGNIIPANTPNFTPRFPGTALLYQHSGVDSNINFWNGSRWINLIPGFDSTSLSNRINLKLNITDTTNKWWGIGKRWADTLYRVNDSTIGYTINGSAHTFQILGGSHGGGGGGGLTSVGLSMPSAFNVTGSPLTSNGTISVSGAGTTAQYIRGNGTLATTDTGMIPNFYLKVRGLLSGTSPITFNQTTGVIGVLRANTTGQLGVATFNNSDFTDDGSGLISLRSSGGGGVTSLNPIGSTPNANGATITGSVLNLEPTNGTYGGVLNTDTQTIAGSKAFISKHNTIEGFSARLNSQWIPTLVTDTIYTGRYNGFGITDIFPNGVLVTVYSEGANHLLDSGNIVMRKSFDNGRTWTNTDTIVAFSTGSIPAMGGGGVSQSGRLIIAYFKYFSTTFQSLNIIYSDDQGATWSSPYALSTGSNTVYEPYGPLVKIGGDSLLISWYGSVGSTMSSYIVKSGDDGKTWSSPITIVSDNVNQYSETSVAYLGGGEMVALPRSEVTNQKYGQYISHDNGNTWTSQGTTTWGLYASPCWLKTFMGPNSKRVVVGYHRDGPLGAYQERAIYAYGEDLINSGISGWDLNSEVGIADSVNGSGYLNVVHPYDNMYGIGWYYDETVPQTVSTMKFLSLPKSNAIPIKTEYASDVILDDAAGNGNIVAGFDNNGKLTTIAGGAQNQWIQSGSDVYRLNNVGIGAAPVSGNDLHINKTTNSRFVITAGTASGHVGDMLLTEDNSFGAGTYAQILRYSNANSNNGLFNINNIGKEISLSTQFSGGFVKNISINSAGGVGIQNTASSGVDFHVNKLSGSATVYITNQAASNNGSIIVIGQDANAAPGTYAQFGRFASTAISGLLPGDLFFHNDGGNITFTTLYSGGFRKDMQVLSSGKVRFNDAYTFPNTIGSVGQSLRVPASGTELEWYTPSGGTTLYSGDGTLAGNRTVTGSSNNLIFSGMNLFKVFSNYFYQAKADGSWAYASAIDPGVTGRQSWQFGYLPFLRGVGLYVDTLNNVGLGDVTQTNMPLYTTGNSVFVRNGFQSYQGNFYGVLNVSSTSTLGLTANFCVIDATSGNITITLPAASAAFGSAMGLDLVFKRIDNSGNTVTIQRNGSDLIDGASSFTLATQYASKKIRAISTSAWAIYQ